MTRRRRKMNPAVVITTVTMAGFILFTNNAISKTIKGVVVSIVEDFTDESLQAKVTFDIDEKNSIYLSLIDEDVLENFYKDGGIINVSDETLENSYNQIENNTVANAASGSYNIKTKEITLSENLFDNSDGTILHEFGHYIDEKYNYHLSEAFIAAADDEIKGYNDCIQITHANRYTEDSYELTGDYSEYFAEAYKEYLLRPMFLKYIAPETFKYMDEYVFEYRN